MSTNDGGISKSGRKRTKKPFHGYVISDLARVPVLAELDETPSTKKSRKSKKSQGHSTEHSDAADGADEQIKSTLQKHEMTDPAMSKTKKSRKNRKSAEHDVIPEENITTTQSSNDTTNTNAPTTSTTTQENKSETNTPTKTKVKKKKWKNLPKDESNKTTLSELREIKQDSALSYLKQWYKQRQEWNFKKRHQIWLLQNAYKDDKITDKMFAILLKYLENLQGGARQRITDEAVAIIEDDATDQTEKKTVRAREILYAIQDS